MNNAVRFHIAQALHCSIRPAHLDIGLPSSTQTKVEPGIVTGQITTARLAFSYLTPSSRSDHYPCTQRIPLPLANQINL